MHLIKSNKVKLLLCSLIFSNLYAQNQTFDEKILSEKRLKNFDLTKEQIQEIELTILGKLFSMLKG